MLRGSKPDTFYNRFTSLQAALYAGPFFAALSFAALAKIMKSPPYSFTIVSFDFRGHGDHYCENENEMS